MSSFTSRNRTSENILAPLSSFTRLAGIIQQQAVHHPNMASANRHPGSYLPLICGDEAKSPDLVVYLTRRPFICKDTL